jgi:hypothetical protein
MLGNWIRPWPGELVAGQIIAVSGEWLICRAPGGVEFHVRLSDVKNGMVMAKRPRRRIMERTLLGYRLTPKALAS